MPQRDPIRDAVADMLSEFAKLLVMMFVMPPLLTIAAMTLVEWMR